MTRPAPLADIGCATLVALLLIGVASPGCGGAPDEIPPSEFLDRVAAEVCAGDRACLDAWRQDAAQIDLEKSLRAGRIAYDARQAAVCLASLGAADCGTLDALNTTWPWDLAGVTGCDRMLEPLQVLGAPCASSIECFDGSCFTAEGQAADQCQPVRAAGDSCPSFEACAAGLFCDSSSRCRAQVPVGTACSSADECAGEGDCVGAVCQAPPSACF